MMIQRRSFITSAAGLAAAVASGACAQAANPASSFTLAIPRTNGSIEPRRMVQAEKLGWSYVRPQGSL
jgi:hypothetical protein